MQIYKLNTISNSKINSLKQDSINFQGVRGPKAITLTNEQKKEIQQSYYNGSSLEDLSKRYRVPRVQIAQSIDEADIVDRFLATYDTLDSIGKEFFTTKQTVYNIVQRWGCPIREKRGSEEYVKAILEAKEAGMSVDEIVKAYGNNK